MSHKDKLFRFLVAQAPVRGEYLHIDETLRAITAKQPYPLPVRILLGEALAAASLLSATLKFDGALTLQVQGNGPVPLLVVQASSLRTLRGMAKWREEALAGDFSALLGNGQLVVTVEAAQGRERYQSIVPLGGASLAAALDHYFRQSEQLDTRLWISSDGECAAGLLLQQLPEKDYPDDDAWQRLCLLTETVSDRELLELDTETLLQRLYHQETLRLFDPDTVTFLCTCSRGKVEETLRSLGYDEVQASLREQEQPVLSVECSFCNHSYRFDAVDIERIFATSPAPDLPPTRH